MAATRVAAIYDSLVVHRDSLDNYYDTLAVHLDTLQALRDSINNNYDTLVVHRTDINSLYDSINLVHDSTLWETVGSDVVLKTPKDVDLGDYTLDTKRLLQSNNGFSIFIGENAGLNDDLSNNINTFVGFSSGLANTSGVFNTYIGGVSGTSLTIGNNNTCVGFNSGGITVTGNNNTHVGAETDASSTTASNEIALGANVTGNGDSTATIGGIDFKEVYFGQNGEAALYGGSITLNGGYVIKSTTATITASTTQTQGQQPLTTDINEISTVGNANDAVTLMTAVAGLEIFIINNGSNTLQIFPASSDDLGAGVNSSTTLAAGSNVTFVSYNTTNWEIK